MILGDQDIQTMSSGSSPLVSPFEPQSLRLSSYDLTVGNEYYDGATGKNNSVKTEPLLPGQSFTIPPHGVCFILAAETITLPKDVTAKVSLRMSLVYLGLVMTSQPPFDPGYSGKVIVMVHNLSSQPHHLKRGSRMATIEFSRVGSLLPATNPPTHRSVVDLLGQLTAPVSSSLTDIAKSAASAQKRVQWLVAQMVIFATLLLAMAAVPALSAYSIFSDRQAEQKVRIDELTKSVADNNLAMDSLKQKLVEAVDEHELLVEHLKRQTSDVQPLNRAKTAVVGGTPAKQQQ